MARRRLLPYIEWSRSSDDCQEYVSINRVAAMLGISRWTVYRLLRAGRMLPAVGRCGARLRWRREDVIRWAQAGFPDVAWWGQLQHQAGEGAEPLV
jgi:excisionase family DNA binding protein